MRKKFDEQFKAMIALEAVKEELTLRKVPSPSESDQRLEEEALGTVLCALRAKEQEGRRVQPAQEGEGRTLPPARANV